ncbi:translocation/assembly module TamB domain-containing protein [Moheibacter lacus]|uniref:Translocation/assembly module TamB n=1 Tax=Moheibacter lacus TaxID=2745851 RepID=A0A838ZEP1_9FLAO|nr:translocation/assembly module TamB [Moheibacter lacus]MBA5628211.1 translocation/assembly module TamB [Moheibacter lacus]
MKFKLNKRKLLKWIGISLGAILILLILLILSLRIPAVQNYVKDKLIVYLEDKIQTEVHLDKVYIAFPNRILLENLYLQGQELDTLLAVRNLDVGLNMWKLLDSQADFTSIDLQGVRANVVRNPDGTFNFDYILDAFATDEKEEESKPFIISLDKIELQDIGISFIDNQSSNDINVFFNHLKTRVKTFDLEENSYALDELNLDGLKLRLHQDFVEEVAENVEKTVDSLNQQKPMSIDLNAVKFTNFNVDYGDDNAQTYAKILFKELSAEIDELDLQNNSFEIDKVLLSGARIKADLFSPENSQTETTDDERNKTITSTPKLILNQLVLEDVEAVYNNTAMANTQQGIDFNHLDFSDLNLELRNFQMENNEFVGRIESAEIQEKSGLHIQEFRTDFAYQAQQAFLKNLYLQTPKTILRDEIVLNYSSIAQLSEDLSNVEISADLYNSKIGFSDILTLAPDLRNTTPFNKYPNASLHLDAEINGIISDLFIQNLEVSGLDDLKLKVRGRLRNATNPENIYYDLNIAEFSSLSKTIYNLVPPNTIPPNISLPSSFTLRGKAKGTTEIIYADLKLNSTLGNAAVLANLNMRQKNRETYDVKANLRDLQIGKIIQNKELGAISADISAKGESFDFARANADLAGDVAYVDYNGYRYRNMNLIGKIRNGNYDIELISKDPNADLNLVASGIFNEENPTVKLDGTITKLDLNQLGFYADPMILAGNIAADFTNLNPDELNGYLHLKNFAISDTEEVFPIQDLTLNALYTADSTKINLQSQVVDLELNGKYKITQIFGSLQQTLNQYYEFQPVGDSAIIDPNQYFTLDARIKNDDLIRKFLPDLQSFETIVINGNYDADSRKLELNAEIPQVSYGEYLVENARVQIQNENQAIHYKLNVAGLNSESFALNRLSLFGDVADNVIRYNLIKKDEKEDNQFLIAGTAESLGEVTEISLNPDGLKLDYKDWAVAENNKIQIGPDGIFADNFRISNQGNEILVQSESNSPNSPLNVEFTDFEIANITEIIRKDSLLAEGRINGNVQLRNLTENLNFTSDLTIRELGVFGNPIGDLAVKVNNTAGNILNADVALSGNNNDVKILGDYNLESASFDLAMDINRLQMQSVQGLSMNQIIESEGYLSGNLNLTGTTEAPRILGSVQFNDVGLQIAQTGSDFRNINDEIDFTQRGIEFDNFKINDNDGNSLNINGQVLTQSYRDFAFNLDLTADDFKVVNSEKNNEAIMYGVLSIDADLRIRGDLDLPIVDGNLAVADDTDFTFVLPQESPTLQEREGIVEFIDKDQPVLNETLVENTLNSQTNFTGMDVNVNIEVSKEAKMSIIIDKANGDFVELQGEADLTGGIDPSGKITLVGVYQVEKGGYELSVSMLRRKFDIQKGSTITWNGEPTEATLDITAIYKTEAPPIDLVEQQISGKSNSEMNQYKQRIPFNTLLKLKGELLKPEISFDIEVDEENAGVSTMVLDDTKQKLQQLRNEESELNKQVFALLLLNRFVGENPFDSGSGLSAESLARQSVSKILSQQLNNLTEDLIEGVDLNFDLESTEDYTSGQKNTRTDLNVGVSKRLLNDRLKVSVGSNFGIEGDARQNENTTNIAGDVTIDYNLSKDGRYMLRAYRKDEYQVALQGQIVETGVGFIITLDYDKFREIFQRSKEKKKNRNKEVEFK